MAAWPGQKMATGINYCQNGRLAKANVTLWTQALTHSLQGFSHKTVRCIWLLWCHFCISRIQIDELSDHVHNVCRAAKNSDFVRVIGIFNPPLRVRTDIYAINDLFGLWTRYKIGINLNYSDTSHFAHAHGTSYFLFEGCIVMCMYSYVYV